MSTVHALVPNRSGILDRVAALLQQRGVRLRAIALSRGDGPDTARLTMQVHEDDVPAVLAQLERHVLGSGESETSGEASEGLTGSYRWQADGAHDDEAA